MGQQSITPSFLLNEISRRHSLHPFDLCFKEGIEKWNDLFESTCIMFADLNKNPKKTIQELLFLMLDS
jgi:hypothetical protein